ncbi:SP_1767 family glycosyltransferase [Metabacillus halosaccharovorans]|uniref:SP_1767 family glycosyltransferase n=1 Tax=Metabacillus halosaccharovorans TaxID=930124 RepID=A0ABT3DCL7_9BACI|nr:SP_1767 family glycosyltransferase [Metabacillus halosaccharovorans]MCV9884797.1 SP_1767 family glycosyltransferase [Metabacillus halosaccharovorans]
MKILFLKIYYKILKIKDLMTVIYNKIFSFFVRPPLVKSTEETLNKIISGQVSISRYGDGEFSLMYGRSLLFQQHSKELQIRLREIINSKHKNHEVCIPNVFNNVDHFNDKPKRYWLKYLNLNRAKIYKLIDSKKEYYDSLVTRLYIDYQDKSKSENYFQKIKGLWNKRDIIIVEGEQSRLGMGNDLFDNVSSIKRIICPSMNAFSKYNEILNEVKKYKKSDLILIALGPTATILAYDLSKSGFQAIDIGHIDIEYEWFLQNAVEKTPVKNKYIGEVPNGTKVEEIEDKKYKSEIISKVV